VRDSYDVCGCFPTGRHYAGIADKLSAFVNVQGLCSYFSASGDWREAKLAVIDLETTGLSPDTDRVIEVGIAFFDQGALSSRRNWLINPGIPVPPEARAVHQINDDELATAPFFGEVFSEICEFLRDSIPVAYNASFDFSFLKAEINRLSSGAARPSSLPIPLQPQTVWIDPLVWAREIHANEKSKKLVDVCSRLGIELKEAHRAAGDAEATGKVLFALAPQMPITYGDLIRLQKQYAARQELDLAGWRKRRA